MKPVVILSCDTNPDYLFLLPITAKTWELQGWEVCANVESNKRTECIFNVMPFGSYEFFEHKVAGLSLISVSQIIRLLHTTCQEDRTVCIGDVDMLLASDFLYKRFDLTNVFGHDLTNFEHIPICYVTATRDKWLKIIDFNEQENWEEWILQMIKKHGKENPWCWDQDILTGQLKEYGYENINFINRGTDPNNHNLPLGRWDRYGNFKKPTGQIHDVHLMRKPYTDDNFCKLMEILYTIYPNENWDWVNKYRNEFLKEIKL